MSEKTAVNAGSDSPFLKSMESNTDQSLSELAANALLNLRGKKPVSSDQNSLEEYRVILNDAIEYFKAVAVAKKSYLAENGLDDEPGLAPSKDKPDQTSIDEQVIEYIRRETNLNKKAV